MSPARETNVNAIGRARILRNLLDEAQACRILLRDEEVASIEDAIALYDDDGVTETDNR